MIRWLQQEDVEGRFNSKFFRNDEGGDEFIVYANSDDPDFMESAEKCVDSFNSLSESVINEICQKLISCAQEGDGLDEEFELPALDNPLDILDYCWFMALYVDMKSIGDEIAYITIGANETAQTYEARQKRTYWTIAGVSAAYLLVWLAVNGLLLYKRRKAGETE